MVVRERQYVLAAAAWYVGPNGEPSGMSAGGWEFLACLCERGAAFAMRRHHYKLRDRLNADGCPRLGTWRFLLRQSSFRSLFVFGHDTPALRTSWQDSPHRRSKRLDVDYVHGGCVTDWWGFTWMILAEARQVLTPENRAAAWRKYDEKLMAETNVVG
jgi:hypothetical protein